MQETGMKLAATKFKVSDFRNLFQKHKSCTS